MPPTIAGPLLNQSTRCLPILRMLPEWFGIESAILDYEREMELMPTFLAEDEGKVRGFLCLKQHNSFSAEIHIMAVDPQFHRSGIGRALVSAAETYSCAQGIEFLQVKTLGPSHPDQGYAKTRRFYQAMGYRPLEEFMKIWDEKNPCLVMVKRL